VLHASVAVIAIGPLGGTSRETQFTLAQFTDLVAGLFLLCVLLTRCALLTFTNGLVPELHGV
jgi:hypothetical protein